MQKKLVATPAIAGLIALPIAGYTALYLLDQQNFNFGGDRTIAETSADKPEANAQVSTSKPAKTEPAGKVEVEQSRDLDETLLAPAAPPLPKAESSAASGQAQDALTREVAPAPMAMEAAPNGVRSRDLAKTRLFVQPSVSVLPAPVDTMPPQAENRDRIEDFISLRFQRELRGNGGARLADPLFAKALAAALFAGFVTVFNQYGGDDERLKRLLGELLSALLGNTLGGE